MNQSDADIATAWFSYVSLCRLQKVTHPHNDIHKQVYTSCYTTLVAPWWVYSIGNPRVTAVALLTQLQGHSRQPQCSQL